MAVLLLFECKQIGPFQTANSERTKVKVKVRLNIHGIVSLESAMVSFFGFRGPSPLNYNKLRCELMVVNREHLFL